MRDELARERAIDGLRYGQGQQAMNAGLVGAVGGFRRPELTDDEIKQIEAEQRKWRIQSARREALGHTLALGRRYDEAAQAIEDAKTIAAWLGLEVE